MKLQCEKVDVWAAPIEDKPGGLATVLDGLSQAGADLEFVIARRSPDTPGKGVVFVSPIRGDRETDAAATLGFDVVESVASVRIEGENVQGVGAVITERLSAAGIDLRGLSAAVIGRRFIVYIGFDSHDDASHAIEILSGASQSVR